MGHKEMRRHRAALTDSQFEYFSVSQCVYYCSCVPPWLRQKGFLLNPHSCKYLFLKPSKLGAWKETWNGMLQISHAWQTFFFLSKMEYKVNCIHPAVSFLTNFHSKCCIWRLPYWYSAHAFKLSRSLCLKLILPEWFYKVLNCILEFVLWRLHLTT
jgi:hypothetical protein